MDINSEIKLLREFHEDSSTVKNVDWQRLKAAYKMIKGSKVLDVGIGNGFLCNLLSVDDTIEKIVGIDYKPHSSQKLKSKKIEYFNMNVQKLEFEDNSFDTTFCMEVLEHLGTAFSQKEAQQWLGWDDSPFYRAINELKRVTKRRLILTVPFEEKFPLFHYDKPTGHKRIFNKINIPIYFPDGKLFTFHHWLFIVIDNPIRITYTDLFSREYKNYVFNESQ